MIDDEPAIVEWLTALLDRAGYEVQGAGIGARGEELVTAWSPDTVITDMGLPDIDGIDLVRKVRQRDHAPEVIVVTGNANILIQSENGTGKELIANAIHACSKRPTGSTCGWAGLSRA